MACELHFTARFGNPWLRAMSEIPPPEFRPLPTGEPLQLDWPTPNDQLHHHPERFFATTRANLDYGKPGWTRDCGKRFHRGCDIAPRRKRATGQTTVVEFTDCATGKDYESSEPTFVPEDEIFCVFAGEIDECVTDPATSDFGIHLVLKHQWQNSGTPFYTLYAHLERVLVKQGQRVSAGQQIGRMGATSRIADARNWMAVTPHLHFEVWDEQKAAYDPVAFLRAFVPEP